MRQISAASLEYVRVRVEAIQSGSFYDPTADAVAMAFIGGNADPVSGDWKTASWDSDTTATPAVYRAQCLVGPAGTVTLTAGVYAVWVKITDSPEIPVKRAGQIKIV